MLFITWGSWAILDGRESLGWKDPGESQGQDLELRGGCSRAPVYGGSVKTWSSEVAAPGLQYMEEEKAKGGDSSFSYQSFEAFSREKEASWDSMEIF